MNTKTCLYCGESFTPKRSDAVCCSDKCRSAFNYKKKQRQDLKLNNSLYDENALIQEKDIVIKGELDTSYLISKVSECETKIDNINSEIAQIEKLKNELSAQIFNIKNEIHAINTGEKAKLERRNDMTDLALYNNFINRQYLTEKNKGNEFAHNRLKNESDINNKFNPILRLEIDNYRNRIVTAIQKLDNEISNKHLIIDNLKAQSGENCTKIKELQNQLRFYESRVLKYEALLLSV